VWSGGPLRFGEPRISCRSAARSIGHSSRVVPHTFVRQLITPPTEVTFHDLRHHFASVLTAAGCSIKGQGGAPS
jgi:hypothetical protein